MLHDAQPRRTRRWGGRTLGVWAVMVALAAIALAIAPVIARATAAGSHKYVSVGPSETATTYYVDAEGGDDNNAGTSPDQAWKTLDKVSATTFEPGDHILLRASSTWNGDSEYKGGSAANDDLRASGNTLWPKGSGTADNPIVIDLYELDESGQAVYGADTRPTINGNGTWGIGAKKTMVSAPVMLYNQDGFEIRNLEVTNMPADQMGDPEAYKANGAAQRCGILVYEDDQDRQFSHLVIEGCFVHDVQTEHHNKRNDTSFEGLKATGGIIVLGHYLDPDAHWMVGGKGSDLEGASTSDAGKARVKIDDILIQNNYVKRVGLEGIRTKCQSNYTASGNTFNKTFTNVVFRGNYMEDIAGDGMVMTEVVGGLAENNVAKRPCDADYGTTNYAGIWSMFADDVTFQHNEVYGIRYGYNDGEAYDIDLSCENNVYQYNYSHDNSGGFMLFMGDQKNSVVRYNVSANDGYGNQGTSADIPGLGSSYTYAQQSIFHYWNKADNATMPTIYNNTIYVGDGYDTSLFGEGNNSDNTGVIARLYNNLVVKEGEGSLTFLSHYPTNGGAATETKMGSASAPIEKLVRNNVFPEQMVTDLYDADEFAAGGNVLQGESAGADISLQGNADLLSDLQAQTDVALSEDASAAELEEFTSTARLLERTQMFKLVDGSAAIAAGEAVEGAPSEDFYGNQIVSGNAVDAGAHQASALRVSTEVKSVEDVRVETRAGYYPELPSEVSVTFVKTVGEEQAEYTEQLSVSWDFVDAEKYATAGDFTVEGSVEGIDAKATATVTVTGEKGEGDYSVELIASDDAFVQAKDANKAYGADKGGIGSPESYAPRSPLGKSFSGGYVLKVKNATDQSYNRRTVVKFDLSELEADPSELSSAVLRLHVSRYDSYNQAGSDNRSRFLNTTRVIDVYDIGNDWTGDTVTWNNTPDMEKASSNHGTPGQKETVEPTYETYKPVAQVTLSNAEISAAGDVIEIDVTDYVRSLPEGTQAVSFLIDTPYSTITGSNVDNGGFDAFSVEGAAAAYEAYQNGQLPATREDVDGNDVQVSVESATSLAPSLSLSDAYPVSVEEVSVSTKVGVAPELPESVNLTMSDGSVVEVSVTWPKISSDLYASEGSFTVTGATDATSMPIRATVTVGADHITAFHNPSPITASVGTQLSDLMLPETVTADVTRADGTTGTVEVTVNAWRDNEVAYNPNVAGTYYLIANVSDMELPAGTVADETAGRARIEVTLTSTANVAQGRPVTYSGVEGDKDDDGNWTYPQFVGESAVDGSADTRWSAAKTDEQWLVVDLQDTYKVESVVVDFHAESPEYEVLVSLDGEEWTPVAQVSDGSQGSTVSRTFSADGVSARYVKYLQKKMWLHSVNGKYYGSSIVELKVMGSVDDEANQNTLRVATFNIASGKQPDTDAMRALLLGENVELAGVQEVDLNVSRSGNRDVLADLAGDAYPHHYFSEAIPLESGSYGNGTISLYEFSETGEKDLTKDETCDEQRVYQRVVIEKNGHEVAFYNTHLNFENTNIREIQMAELKAAIEADPVPYKVLVGDFNADQYHEEFYTFLEDLDMVNGYGGTWYDTFNGVDETMKTDAIDNIVFTRNLKIESAYMVETELSDHNLLVAEFEFLDEPRVSTEWLRAELDRADGVDEGAYSESSLAALVEAREAAQSVMEQQGATQEQIDEAARNLEAALDALESFNLALGKATTTSGLEVTDGRFTDAMAVDGVVSSDSRWSGAKTDEQWLQVDLGGVKTISEVIIRFHAESPDWELQLSADGEKWETVHSVTDGADGGPEEVVQRSFEPTEARYVKYVQHKMWNHSNGRQYSTSIYELEVYEGFDIEGIEVSDHKDVLGVGESFKLGLTVTPAEAAHKAMTYTSSNEDVATVSEDGTVTGVSAGTVTITAASAADPSISASCEIRVIDGFALDLTEDELSLVPRDKRFLTYDVVGTMPEGAEVSWRVSDESVASVDESGLLTPSGTGTATVTLVADGVDQDSLTVTVSEPDYSADYDTMQDRWIARLTGGEDLDLSDPDIVSYVAKIGTEGQQLWDELDTSEDRDRLWPKVESDTTSADYTTQFTKIKKLALAFGVKGQPLYQNAELLEDIVDAVNFMVSEKNFNGSYTTGNWWDWQIGCPQPLCDILMIVSDYVDYDQIEPAVKAIEGYCKAPNKRFNGYTETGANLTDTGLSVLGSAIVAHNDERMQLVQDQVPSVMDYVTSGDGLYEDGSVIQHTKVAYTGAYGNELVKGIGRITSIVADTQWEINDERIENVYETILEGYIPLMHRGQMMAMVCGRSITRAPGLNNFTHEFQSGSETISNILLIAQSAPDSYKEQFNAAVKGWLEDIEEWGDFDFYGNARDFDALLQAKSVANDDSIEGTTWSGMKVYGSMDRVVQATDTYEVGLAMYSKRTYNYEAAVGSGTENAHGWHTGDGALYIYNGDLDQWGEGFWATVDPYRIPGTTVDTRELDDCANQSKTSPQSWVGGVTDGTNGAAGMYYNANGMSGMDLQAKKSWFFLPGQIVALGTDINGTTGASIETTVENRMITDESNAITVNGEAFEGEGTKSMQLEDGSYVHFTGTGEGNDLGYYFVQGGDVDVTRETRSGKYSDINSVFPSDDVYTNEFFKMGINHGQEVTDGSYAYVILPGATEGETAEYASDPEVEVLSNTEEVQAILDAESGIFAMNTWPTSSAGVGGFTVSTSASVYAQNKDGMLTISLSDPKQSNAQIVLTLDFAYDAIESLSEGVTQNEDGTFTFDTTGLTGGTQQIVLKVGDKTELAQLVDQASALVEDDYTPESWSELKDALEAANDLLAGFATSQEELDSAHGILSDAIDALEEKAPEVDRSAPEAEALAEGDYTADSWATLSEALDAAREVLASDAATQGEVDEAAKALADAIDALVEKAPEPTVDYTALSEAISAAEALDADDYTADSWAQVEAALEDAKAALGSDDQAAVDKAAKALADAIDALVEKAPEPTVDYDALNEAISAAKALDADDYTADSWAALSEALDAAKAALGSDDQAAVDKAAKALADAIDALEEKAPEVDRSALSEAVRGGGARGGRLHRRQLGHPLRGARRRPRGAGERRGDAERGRRGRTGPRRRDGRPRGEAGAGA